MLDTQAYLWFVGDDPRLSLVASEAIQASRKLYLSVASLWEIGIKVGLGKLDTPLPVADLVRVIPFEEGISILPVRPEHVLRVASLPHYHRDPFDRMIIAQALEGSLPIVGSDRAFDAYGVRRVF